MEPIGRKGKARAKRSLVKDQDIGTSGKEDPKDLTDSDQDGVEESPVTDTRGRKRPSAGSLDKEVWGEEENLVERSKERITKSVLAKKRRLEMNTSAALEVTNQKLEEVLKTPKEQRQNLPNECSKQLLALLQQSDTDLNTPEEPEVSFKLILQQQQRLLQQCRALQKQTQREMKSLHKEFVKNVEKMKKDCENFLTQTKSDLSSELALAQSRLTEESQRQMMAAIQLQLQSGHCHDPLKKDT